MPSRDLRAVTLRLQIRSASADRKADWVAVIVDFWQTPDQRDAHWAALSPAAQAALYQLAGAVQWPWVLFQAEYGTVRRPGQYEAGTTPPWVAPQSISEELYYSGLLHPVDGQNIEKTELVCAPDFVATLLHRAAEASPVDASAWPLLHDLAQYLIYRHQHPELRPLHGRWLSRSHMAALNRRLLQPEAAPLPRSHKATLRLSLLAFLAEAAGLVSADGITALGWQWLAEVPAAALMRLWQGWQQSAPALRARYDLPDADLDPPWPRPLLHLLSGQAGSFTAAALVARLLGDDNAPWRYYVANFPDSVSLVMVLGYLLDEPLRALGVVTPAGTEPVEVPPQQQTWALTATGRWLLHPLLPVPQLRPAPEAEPTGIWLVTDTRSEPPAPISAAQRPGLLVGVPATQTFATLASLAVFAAHVDFQQAPDTHVSRHVYLLNRETVARAAADGHPFSALQTALAALAIEPAPATAAILHRWHEQGRALRLTHLPLLRSQQPEQMVVLWQDPRLRPLLGELLAPTVATLVAPLDEAAQLLRQAGHFVPLPPNRHTALADAEASQAENGEGFSPAAGATLWLAGQIYQQLGAHLALPAPLSSATLERLWRGLDPIQQALLQSQLDRVQEALAALLDGYALTPPVPNPHATDPAQWRARIDSAVNEKQQLRLRYYSAGRNLLTERTVDPYWIEERHGFTYLRAYCHSAGRVLVFRLDRIQGLEVIGC